MRIGEIAKRSGIAPSKIRFYEARGLLPSPQRCGNGYRDYPPAVLATLRFIEDAQKLGFSLREITAVVPRHEETGISPPVILPSLERKLHDTEALIAAAKKLRRRLRALVDEQRACLDGSYAVTASPG